MMAAVSEPLQGRQRSDARSAFLCQEAVEAAKIEQSKGELACQEAPEVACDAVTRHSQENEAQAEEKADHIHAEEMSRQPQSLKDAG